MNELRFFSQRPPWPKLDFDRENNCYTISQYKKSGWLVSVSDFERKIVPYIKAKEELLPLVWDKRASGYIIPPKEGRFVNALDEAINGRAGKLVLYDETGEALSPYLYIFSDTISEEDYAAILDRLGQLAIAYESGILAPVTVLRENESGSDRKAKGDVFENLARVVDENWENIKKNPAKEIKLDTKIIDLTNPQTVHSARVINQSTQKPHQRKQQILERQETYDAEENRFLAYVLKEILLPKSKSLAEFIRSQATKIRAMHRKPDAYRHGQSYVRLWQERRVELEQEAKRLETRAIAIEQSSSKIETYLNEPFLKDVRPNHATALRPSAKIANSKEYGPVYRAYQEYLRNTKSSRQKSLSWALEEKSIHRTSKLFEMWVFFELYSQLVNNFGFSPEGKSPFDTVEVMDGELTLVEGAEFHLSFTPQNSKAALCTATLSFSPRKNPPRCKYGSKACFEPNICPSMPCYRKIMDGDWDGLKPDITLEIRTGIATKKIALDVKHRNYKNQPYAPQKHQQLYQVVTFADADLFGTAKMKYYNGLNFDAAFVLHSDPSPQYTLFGEKPFYTTPLREQKLGLEEWWPGHKVGAVCVTPRHAEYWDNLLRCFLMYHANLVAVCWNSSCHSLLTKENGGMKKQPERGIGDYYQCPSCGEFWISQVCSGPQHHRLVKMGRDSFHKVMPGNEWSCTCPACGDEFDKNNKSQIKLEPVLR